MNQKVKILIVLLSFIASHAISQSKKINLIPQPVEVNVNQESFTINSETTISASNELNDEALYLSKFIKPSSGFSLDIVNTKKQKRNSINLRINKKLIKKHGKEAYKLVVNNKNIIIEASDNAGVFYGIQTLLQLLPTEVYSRVKKSDISLTIPGVNITDYPRFGWRGFMLDASRSFQPLSYVKRTIDLMALHKLNILHWHLTDDHGWRIEIKKYPWLTEVAGYRNQKNYPEFGKTSPYGGYYTQQELREIVDYAAKRHITIIPEVDLPGHSSALVYAMPELVCDNVEKQGYIQNFTDYPMRSTKYVRHKGSNVVCAGKEITYQVAKDVIDELVDIFPSKYIHIGGDEVQKKWWQKCPHCNKKMKKEGLKDYDELQAYFIRRMETYIQEQGRQLIGWDEILEGGLSKTATVMSWRGLKGAIKAAKEGRKVVIASNKGYYIQRSQSKNPYHPQKWPRFKTTEEIYKYNPIPENFTPQDEKLVLGIQTSLWTPFMHKPDVWDLAIYPRNCALSEAAWTPKTKHNYNSFAKRLNTHLTRLAYKGVSYWREGSEKIGTISTNSKEKATISIDITNKIKNPGVYFIIPDYTEGDENGFRIDKAEIFKDGKLIRRDKHLGFTTANKDHDRIYYLDVQEVDKNSKYEVKISFNAQSDNECKGEVLIFQP